MGEPWGVSTKKSIASVGCVMTKIYDLHNDRHTIKLIQDATLNTEDYGLKPEHGLFGSQEWWQAVEQGVIPKKQVEGVISRVYMTGHNDFPEFEVTSETGKTKWERKGNDKYYVVGKRVKILYVTQKFKKPLRIRGLSGKKGLMTDSDVMLEIWGNGEGEIPESVPGPEGTATD